ncbi:chymotrypsin-2-like [Agrilus planipennis]|uniref:Chymotrypsin-2-like n=1 Tax=Agrilus planipennis TaxID=224129 RepID=A0A7F5RH06_AGRPL|nr:chymotrypsin-2-like [Agrilus planipennis]
MKFLVILLGFVCTAALAAPNAPNVNSFHKTYIKDREISPSDDTRIIGGQNAIRNQFPYQVSVQWDSGASPRHFCGGSLISASVVLTAAHCIQSSGSYSILAGILSLDENSSSRQSRGASSIVVHENWPTGGSSGSSAFDIALIKVNPPFDLSSSVQPIALPSQGADVSGAAIYSGWGRISTSDPLPASVLQYAIGNIISNQRCADILVNLFTTSSPLDDSQICTDGEQGVAACSGDRGGPLVRNGVQVGIAAWGPSPCGVSTAPTVSTKVSSYVNWINANM